MTSADLLAALRTRYAPPEWYLVSEVANGTGWHGDRTTYADAVAVSAYQKGKTGAEIHGFEIKVSRSDFLNELKHPGKAEAVRKFCDRWWLVTPAQMVHVGELPEAGWGLLEVHDGAAKVVHKAPKILGRQRTRLTQAFLAALVRRASEERCEKEAQKALMLKAPLRQIAIGSYGDDSVVLVCGHLLKIPGGAAASRPGRLKTARCLGCLDGLPPAIELLDTLLRKMSAAELRRFATDATARAAVVETHGFYVGGTGISPVSAAPAPAPVEPVTEVES